MSSRLYFLDNTRYLAIIAVTAFHTAVGYGGMGEFFVEGNTSEGLVTIRHWMNAFQMPLIFFAAGYFTLPSLRGRTYGLFLQRKLLRLGLPFLLGIFFLGPLMPYLGYYSRAFTGLPSDSYWQFWTSYLASGVEWFQPAVFRTQPEFHHQHFYFLSILLQFFAVAGGIYALWRHRQPAGERAAPGPGPAILWVFLLAAVAIPVVGNLTRALDVPGGIYLGLFQFSLSAPIWFGIPFGLGMWAEARGWFTRGHMPRLLDVLLLSVLAALLHYGGDVIDPVLEEHLPPPWMWIRWDLAETVRMVAIITGLLWVTQRFMNGPSRVNQQLAANSYDVYLLQYPVILAFRALFHGWDAPTELKFVLVLVLTLVVCNGLSQYLIRPRPKAALAGLLGLHALLCVTGLPASSDQQMLEERRDELATVVAGDPQRLPVINPDDADAVSYSTPLVGLSWQQGTLYVAYPTGGLHAWVNGRQLSLDDSLRLDALTGLPGDHLAGASNATRALYELSPEGDVVGTLLDSTVLDGRVRHLAANDAGGIYLSVESWDDTPGRILYRDPASGDARVVLETGARGTPVGLALAEGGRRLLFHADGPTLWACDVAANGGLGDPHPVGELFLGDGRYGRTDVERGENEAEQILVDDRGRLFVGSPFGVQVFSPEGRLLGIIAIPDREPSWYRTALHLALKGDGSTLYVGYRNLVYAVPLK